MEITDIRLKLINDSGDRLKAVCTITFDDQFVVRDVKVVEGTSGLFVAMPSRKLSVACNRCGHKNHLRSKYCNECGAKLSVHGIPPDADGRARMHRDIAHPITAAFRDAVQKQVIEAYHIEYERSDDRDDALRTDDCDDAPRTDDDHTEETDEYSALIADLKGGPVEGDRGSPRHGTPARGQEGTGQRGAERGSESTAKRRSRGRRRGRGRADEDREQPAPEVAPREARDVSTFEPATPMSSDELPDDEDTGGPGERPLDDAVHLEEAAGEPATSEDASEDTTAFGAGLF